MPLHGRAHGAYGVAIDSDAVRLMTYDEIADALGIARESARQLVIRKRWSRSKGNDGKARIAVPLEALPSESTSDTPYNAGEGAEAITPSDMAVEAPLSTGAATGDVTAVVTALTRHIERLEQDLVAVRERAAERDVLAGQVEALNAVLIEVRADRDRWHHLAVQPERKGWWPWRRSA